jgi:ABC-type tungstate transport system substrate-binding protein
VHPNGGCGNVDVDHIFVPSFFGYIHAIAIIIALVNVTPTQHNKLGLVLTLWSKLTKCYTFICIMNGKSMLPCVCIGLITFLDGYTQM